MHFRRAADWNTSGQGLKFLLVGHFMVDFFPSDFEAHFDLRNPS